MLSPPKPLDEIQPKFVKQHFFWRRHLGPLEEVKKLISKIFIQNCVGVLTNERYKAYQMGFTFCHLGHVLGVGLGDTWVKNLILPSVCPLS